MYDIINNNDEYVNNVDLQKFENEIENNPIHILLEKFDTDKDYMKIRLLLAILDFHQDESGLDFLKFHIKMTKSIFRYNFIKDKVQDIQEFLDDYDEEKQKAMMKMMKYLRTYT